MAHELTPKHLHSSVTSCVQHMGAINPIDAAEEGDAPSSLAAHGRSLLPPAVMVMAPTLHALSRHVHVGIVFNINKGASVDVHVQLFFISNSSRHGQDGQKAQNKSKVTAVCHLAVLCLAVPVLGAGA